MAAAVRVTEPWLVPIDEFGHAVSRRLRTRWPARQIGGEDVEAQLRHAHPALLVAAGASWRPELTAINDLAAAAGTRWLPVVLRHTRIDVGPVIGPASEACFRCMKTRERQHDPFRRTTEAVERSADQRAAFLPAHVRQAAGIVTRLAAAHAGALVPGSAIAVGLLTAAPVALHPVTGVHGCPGCALRRPGASGGEAR